MSENSKSPTHRVYVLVDRPKPDDKDSKYWHNVGSVFQHADGKGFQIVLEFPVGVSNLVCREIKEEAEPAQPERKSYKK